MPVTVAPGERGLARVVTLPPPSPGFIGEGHMFVPVIASGEFERTDPFILLMDDRVDLPPGRRAGGAHPHAGFESRRSWSAAATSLGLTAGADGARVVLYAGKRQGVPIVTHGPFVGETRADLVRQSTAYAGAHASRKRARVAERRVQQDPPFVHRSSGR